MMQNVYQVNRLSGLSEIQKRAANYPFALVFQMSELYLTKIPDQIDINWDEVLEARFFHSSSELHIYKEGEHLIGVETEDIPEISTGQVIWYQLSSRFWNVGKKLAVKEYYEFDEDGQLKISKVRLAGIQ